MAIEKAMWEQIQKSNEKFQDDPTEAEREFDNVMQGVILARIHTAQRLGQGERYNAYLYPVR